MSRAAAYTLLSQSHELQDLGFVSTNWHRSASTVDPQDRPFGIIVWGVETPEFGFTSTEQATVWVYDEPGSYDRIDKALVIIRQILTDAVHVPGADGRVLTTADWAGNSEDLYDDLFECITKNAAFTVVGRAQ